MSEQDNEGWSDPRDGRCDGLDDVPPEQECVLERGHIGLCVPRRNGLGPIDQDSWDRATGMTRTPAAEAHAFPKFRQVGMTNLSQRVQKVLLDARNAGIKFPEDDEVDLVRDAALVKEILDIDDRRRLRFPQEYAPPQNLAGVSQELRDVWSDPEREQRRWDAAHAQIKHLTARIAKLSKDNDDAHARARQSEAKLLRAREEVDELKGDLAHGRQEFLEVEKARAKYHQGWQHEFATHAKVAGERDEAQNALEALRVRLMQAQRDAERPARVLKVYSWSLLTVLLVILASLLGGCTPQDPGNCPGTPGAHCGCRAPKDACVIPCGSCCATTPCPIDGCADE